MSVTLVCKLCGQPTNTFAKSHVIPKALHLDERGEDAFLWILKGGCEPPQRSPSGEYDQIVCPPCEKRFGPWDDYGVELIRRLRAGDGVPYGDIAVGIEVDYARLKLFVMSMLWRASASTRRTYSRVMLGSKWNEALRTALIAEDPGTEDFFSVTVSLFRDEMQRKVLFDPHREKYFQVNYVRFYVYGGFTLLVKVDERKPPDALGAGVLSINKPLHIVLRDWSPSEASVARRILGGGF